MTLKTFVAIGMVAAVAPLGAQEIGQLQRAEAVRIQLDGQKLDEHRMVLAEKMAIEGLQQRMAVESRFTQGAPYSGEAVNESLQVLADGNRIAKKTTTRVYRDSEGRTRREMIGADGQVQNINISDPVAGVTYVLEPATKTAYRNGVMMVTPSGMATATVTATGSSTFVAATSADAVKVAEKVEKEGAEVRARAVAGARGGGGGTVAFTGGRGGLSVAYPATALGMAVPDVGKTTTEDLGQQIVEGVMATGSRSTTVIEAGAIGNEQPLRVVSEQWFATDLKLLVLTKHSDPRSGETTYRLTNITQAEPSRSLFELPPDYTLKESVIRQRQPALK